MRGKILSYILSLTMAAGIFVMPQTAGVAYASNYPVASGGIRI